MFSRVVYEKRARFLTLDFPASSADLNPLNYFAGGYMVGIIANTKHMILAKFKTYLIKIWDGMAQQMRAFRSKRDVKVL
jgi:hypothetical protein